MRIAVAGAHGQIARQLVRHLSAGGDEVVGLVRNPDHVADVADDGAEPLVVDLERAGVEEVAEAVEGCDAVVFAAGAGPGSGDARKETVDRAGAVLLADAAERAGVRGYLLVSSTGVELLRGVAPGEEPDGVPAEMVPYLRAKLAAEDDLRARDLAWTVLRPGALTDDPPTGRVRLGTEARRGSVPRADVAAVCVALLAAPSAARLVLELVSGGDEVVDAVVAVAG